MSKLTLVNLRTLVTDMKKHNTEKEHFSFNYADRHFDCIFSFKQTAYELLVGIFELNYGFLVSINNHYVGEIDDAIYFRLCELLELNYATNHFSSHVLLTLLSENIPAYSRGVALTYEVLRPYTICRQVDES